MKKYLLLFAIITGISLNAQMDERFYFPSRNLKPIEGLKHSEFSIMQDKDTLSAMYFAPAKKADVSVLFFHGSGGNISSYLFMIKPLVEAGFNVYAIDFRGYGKSTGKPTHQNIAADAQAFFTTVAARKEAKNTKFLIYGASIGTLAAAHTARNNAGKISGLVLEGTVNSLGDIAAVHAPPQFAVEIAKTFAPLYSVEKDVAGLTVPKLFIASRTDSEVPFRLTEKAFAAAAGPKQLYEYTGKHLEGLKSDAAGIIAAMNKMVTK